MSEKIKLRLEDLMLDPEKYYFFYPGHYGDTFAGVGLVREFERRAGAKVVCLIRPSQELIMRLFEIEEYELIDYDYSETQIFWKRIAALSDLCPHPRRGGIFVVFPNPRIHREYQYSKFYGNMMEFYTWVFHLNGSVADSFQRPTAQQISVSDRFLEKISSIASVEKVVLLSPESLSWSDELGREVEVKKYWENEAQIWTERGYKVVVSSIKPMKIASCAEWIDMTMEEAVWLGIHCHHVTARRSGYTDILCFLCKDLTVVYSSHLNFFCHNFYDPFGLEINEIILPGNEMCDANGIRLSVISDIKNLNQLKRNWRMARFLSHVTWGRNRKKYKKQKKELRSRIMEAEEAKEILS